MRLVCLFLLIANFATAQTTVRVVAKTGEGLESVLIFKNGVSNELKGLTDAKGEFALHIDEQSTYLFHLLGYEDVVLTGESLVKNKEVILQEALNQLKQIEVQKIKYKQVSLINKAGKLGIGDSNGILNAIERVNLVTISAPGFLKSLTLDAFQLKPGISRDFRFVIYTSENGQPGVPLVNVNEPGVFSKNKMHFNLSAHAIYLEGGQYFIGYETSKNTRVANNAHKLVMEEPSMISIFTSESSVPKFYSRFNFGNWVATTAGSANKYRDLVYRLVMDIPINY